MALPDILNKITHQNDFPKKESFLALEIWDEGVKSAIWTVDQGKSQVVSFGSKEAWSNKDELVFAVDRSLSTASRNFSPEEPEPVKVIFGLAEGWTTEEKIIPEYQHYLSEICEKLELKPAGFVSIFDALLHYLKETEGAPLSAILVNPEEHFIYLAVVEVGKIKGVQKISRSENLADDVYEGLLRCTDLEVMPSRILLYDGVGVEEQKQVLLNYSWMETNKGDRKLPFLHFPKIEILSPNFDITAVAIAGGNEVAKSLGFEIKPGITPEAAMTNREPVTVTPVEVSAMIEEPDFGFVKGKDVAAEIPEPEIEKEPAHIDQPEVVEAELFQSVAEPEKTRTIPGFKLPKITFALPNLPRPKSSLLFIGLIAVFLLAVGTVGAFWYLPKTEIVIYVTPKLIEKELLLTVDPNQEAVDSSNLILPGQIIEAEQNGSKTISTTGEKTVGDPSRGEVTVYNRTESKKVFPQGTVLVGPGSLKFLLDREVTVASKTPDLVSGVDKWGESKVTVTAADIGSQYNLAAQSQFTIKDFTISSYLAKNESAFAGGSSRQVMAVSEKDQQNLTQNLSGELQTQAKASLQSKADSGTKIIEESITSVPKTSTFNHKIGDEAQELTLNLGIKSSLLAFKEEDLSALIFQVLNSTVQEGYELKKEDLTTEFTLDKKKTDGSILFKVKISANLIPKVETGQLVNIAKGKTVIKAREYLRSNISGFEDAQFLITPNIFSKFQIISWQANHITIDVRRR